MLVLLLGLAFGSLANALVWRIHKDMPVVKDRSKCIHCKHILAWYDLIPILSWLMLRGKCRYCKKNISWQYSVVELTTAVLFLAFYLVFDPSSTKEWIQLSLWFIQITGLMVLLVYDARWKLLPNVVTFPLLTIAIIQVIISGTYIDSLIGAGIGAGFFGFIYLISKGKWIGDGDIVLGAIFGLLLGASKSLLCLLIGFYSAAIFILPLMAMKKLNRKSQIPFGPFLILGIFVSALWGNSLVDYLGTWLGL